MRPAKRILLTLALAQLVVSLALLVARAVSVRAVASPARWEPAPVTVEIPLACPVRIGYVQVTVTRDPATFRYADQDTDGAVCVRVLSARIPSTVTVLIDDRDSMGSPHFCPPPFVVTTPERVPTRELAGDVRMVDRDGNGLACLYETAGRSSIVVIDNISGNPDV